MTGTVSRLTLKISEAVTSELNYQNGRQCSFQDNYSLSKTPFSASISLKSSFVKRFKSEGEYIEQEINLGRSDVEKLRQENLELKASMKTLKELQKS